jgi:hypothetical protein
LLTLSPRHVKLKTLRGRKRNFEAKKVVFRPQLKFF